MLQHIIVSIWWVVSLTIMGVVVYVQYEDTKNGLQVHNWNTAQRTVYETLSRDAWGLAMAWIVYACNTGNAGQYQSLYSIKHFLTRFSCNYDDGYRFYWSHIELERMDTSWKSHLFSLPHSSTCYIYLCW